MAKLQLLGCYMTRDILASIETLRCVTTDKQIEFFAEVFGIPIQAMFPTTRHFLIQQPEFRETKRRRKRTGKTRLAQRRKK